MAERRITFVNRGAAGHWPGVPGLYQPGDLVDLFYDDDLGSGRPATPEETAALQQPPKEQPAAGGNPRSKRAPADGAASDTPAARGPSGTDDGASAPKEDE